MKKLILILSLVSVPAWAQKSISLSGGVKITSDGTNVVVPGLKDSVLTSGNCVQASSGGLLTTTAGACGTSSGTITATGTPASGNLTKFSGGTSITNGDLSGDATTSGTLATTVVGVHFGATGLVFGTAPSSGQCLYYNGTNITGGTCSGSSMVYPGAGIAVSTGSAWATSKTSPTGTIVGTTDTQTLTNKTVDGVTPTVFGYLDATSSVQTQLNTKAPTLNPTFTGQVIIPVTGSTQCLQANSSGLISGTGSACGSGGGASWSGISAASAPLLIDNAAFATTFQQSSGVTWKWDNVTAATSGTAQNSPILNLSGRYWSGASSATDSWTLQNVIGSGTNGTSTLTVSHTGSSGTAKVSMPSLSLSTPLPVSSGGTGATTLAGAGIPATIASGTASLGTSAIASGACASVVTVSASGVASTDIIQAGFNGDPTGVAGYGVSATGALLSIYPYPTTNNVNFKVCNSTASSITPGAITLNWRVSR